MTCKRNLQLNIGTILLFYQPNTTYLVAMKRRMANNESAYQLKGVRKDYGEAQRPKTV